MEPKVQITLKTGVIGTTERQRQTVFALKLRYREASRIVKDSPALRGMVKTVSHLVSLKEVDPKQAPVQPFGGVAEYELGPKPEKKAKEPKKAPSLKSVETSPEHKTGKVKEEAKKEAKGHARTEKAKTAHKPHKAEAKKSIHKTHKKAK